MGIEDGSNEDRLTISFRVKLAPSIELSPELKRLQDDFHNFTESSREKGIDISPEEAMLFLAMRAGQLSSKKSPLDMPDSTNADGTILGEQLPQGPGQ